MMKAGKRKRIAGILAFFTLCSCFIGCGEAEFGEVDPENPWDPTPTVLVPEAPNTKVSKEDGVVLDYSNTAQGYVSIKTTITDAKVKVLVDVAGTRYQYTLESPGSYEVIPLTGGNGSYSIGVYKNLYDDQYTPILNHDINVTLDDEFLPFLYPNQYVNFSASPKAVALSQELCTGAKNELDALNRIYEYMVQNIEYDFEKPATTKSGYIPDPDSTIQTQSGICSDFAVLMASMLRMQGIPTKVVVGYAGTAPHAWISVYTEGSGVIQRSIRFDGKKWVLMDPTFAAADKGRGDIAEIVGDGSNYQDQFYY